LDARSTESHGGGADDEGLVALLLASESSVPRREAGSVVTNHKARHTVLGSIAVDLGGESTSVSLGEPSGVLDTGSITVGQRVGSSDCAWLLQHSDALLARDKELCQGDMDGKVAGIISVLELKAPCVTVLGVER